MIGNVEAVAVHQRVERRKYLLEGKVAGRAEEHEGIGLERRAHGAALALATQLLELLEQFEHQRDAGQH